jgi:hypothetical protein
VQGVLGAVDTLLNHELIEHLPRRVGVRPEIGLHWVREALYALIFIGLGWFDWHGAAAFVIGAALVAEILVDSIDEWTENKVRVLPQNERVLHFILAINLGAITLLLALAIADWRTQPTALVLHDRGWLSWLLTALGVSAAGWSVRDLVAWRRLAVSSAHG